MYDLEVLVSRQGLTKVFP